MRSIDDIPNVVLPDESGTYKHIQVMIKGKDFLRFDTLAYIHGEILEELLKSCNISFDTKEELDDGEIIKIPLAKGRDYELVGAGYCRINIDRKNGLFFDPSSHYKMYTNENHLRSIKQYVPDWDFTNSTSR